MNKFTAVKAISDIAERNLRKMQELLEDMEENTNVLAGLIKDDVEKQSLTNYLMSEGVEGIGYDIREAIGRLRKIYRKLPLKGEFTT